MENFGSKLWHELISNILKEVNCEVETKLVSVAVWVDSIMVVIEVKKQWREDSWINGEWVIEILLNQNRVC